MIIRSSLRPALDADVLAFHGELDMLAAGELEAGLSEALASGEGDLLIDLTCCTFVDSTGLATLVDGDRAFREQKRAMVVAVRSPTVRRTLALAGLDELLEVCWTREEAKARLALEEA